MSAYGIGGERRRSDGSIGLGEGPAGKHRPHDDIGHHEKCGDEGQREQQREQEGAALRAHGADVIVCRHPPRHFRQEHRADGDADHPDRQLVETVGIIQRRQRADRQEGRDDGVGKQCDLRAHGAQRRRAERAEEAPHVLVEAQRRKTRKSAMALQVAGEQEILQKARNQHAPSRRVTCTRKERSQRQCRHHGDIEEDRGRRSTGKALHDVQHAAIERHQRDQQQIGKGDACQLDGEMTLRGIIGEARRQDAHGLRHEQNGQDEQHDL